MANKTYIGKGLVKQVVKCKVCSGNEFRITDFRDIDYDVPYLEFSPDGPDEIIFPPEIRQQDISTITCTNCNHQTDVLEEFIADAHENHGVIIGEETSNNVKKIYLGMTTQHTVRKCPNCSSKNIHHVQDNDTLWHLECADCGWMSPENDVGDFEQVVTEDISHKVLKGYIGENNLSRLFYKSGHEPFYVYQIGNRSLSNVGTLVTTKQIKTQFQGIDEYDIGYETYKNQYHIELKSETEGTGDAGGIEIITTPLKGYTKLFVTVAEFSKGGTIELGWGNSIQKPYRFTYNFFYYSPSVFANYGTTKYQLSGAITTPVVYEFDVSSVAGIENFEIAFKFKGPDVRGVNKAYLGNIWFE